MKTKIALILLSSFNFAFAIIAENVFLPTQDFVSSYPYITGCTVREICNHKLDPITNFEYDHVLPGDTIFVMPNLLEHFFEIYHPRINSPYILITHHFFDEADMPMPGKFANYLEDKKLIAWFTHNPDISNHPKLHQMPIGIANSCFYIGNKDIFDSIIAFANKIPKTKLLYMNIRLESNRAEREKVHYMFRNKPFCTVEQPVKPLMHYLMDLAAHRFVISPRGNGLDCFRTWEALMLGAYPIVRTSTLDSLFEDLPVVIIKKWSEVTQEFLEEKYSHMSKKKYNLDKLYMPYWVNKIKKIQEQYKK